MGDFEHRNKLTRREYSSTPPNFYSVGPFYYFSLGIFTASVEWFLLGVANSARQMFLFNTCPLLLSPFRSRLAARDDLVHQVMEGHQDMPSTVTKFIRKSSFIVALALHLAAVSVANAQVVPDAPQNLAAANDPSTTFTKVVLTWDTPDNIGDSPITHVCYLHRRYLQAPPPPRWTRFSQTRCEPVSNLAAANRIVTENLQSGVLYQFNVALQNSVGQSNWEMVFFTPGFSPTLAVQPTSVAENAAATEVTVTVTLGKKSSLTRDTPVTVSVGKKGTATAGTDYTAIDDFSVTVPRGSLTATGKFTLTPVDDDMVEGNETINISGTAINFRNIAGASLTIVDDDVNSPPVFADETLTRSIAENTAANNNVGSAIPAATDADSDPLTYTMEGTDEASFTFDASNRQIKTKSAVDHEAKSSYEVTIKASDGAASDTVSVTINVTDVAEPPSAPSAPTVSGASTTSLSVSWSAPLNTGKPAITSYDLQYRAGSSGNWIPGPRTSPEPRRRSGAWRRARPTRCGCARPTTRATAAGPPPAPAAPTPRWSTVPPCSPTRR